jgi:hypothetical protein
MGEKRDVCRVLVGRSGGKRPLADPGVDGRIILRWIFRKWDVWIELAQDRDMGQALVNAVMNIRFP